MSTPWQVVRDDLAVAQAVTTNQHAAPLAQSLALGDAAAVSARRATLRAHWTRWVVASVARHFDARRQGLPMFVEGEDHLEDVADYTELRVDGPYVLEPSHNYFRLEVEVNVLVSSAKNATDLYKIYRDCGTVAACFGPSIDVFKLGDGVDDDQSLLGCLVLARSNDQREALRVSHFGQVNAATPILRSSVEGHYHMELRE